MVTRMLLTVGRKQEAASHFKLSSGPQCRFVALFLSCSQQDRTHSFHALSHGREHAVCRYGIFAETNDAIVSQGRKVSNSSESGCHFNIKNYNWSNLLDISGPNLVCGSALHRQHYITFSHILQLYEQRTPVVFKSVFGVSFILKMTCPDSENESIISIRVITIPMYHSPSYILM